MIDLWPDDIKNTRIRAPVTILKEQAALLQKKESLSSIPKMSLSAYSGKS